MRLRFTLNIELGSPDPEPPEQGGTDTLIERSDPYAPAIGFTGPDRPGITYDHQDDQ